jgi:hypothetical protein
LNEGNDYHWLQVYLWGTFSNRLGIGARAKAVAGNLIQWRDLGGGRFHGSCNAPFIHFGLGQNTMVDSLIVYWPSGNVSISTNIPANQIICLSEGMKEVNSFSQNPTTTSSEKNIWIQPNPVNTTAKIDFKISNASQINLSIYNLQGKLISTLINSYYLPGIYSFQFAKENLTSGLYFITLRTDKEYQTEKITIIK